MVKLAIEIISLLLFLSFIIFILFVMFRGVWKMFITTPQQNENIEKLKNTIHELQDQIDKLITDKNYYKAKYEELEVKLKNTELNNKIHDLKIESHTPTTTKRTIKRKRFLEDE